MELPASWKTWRSFYQGLSLLVMPSLAEGFGLAAAEAAACGVPVIATDTSSLPEIVRHRGDRPAGSAAAILLPWPQR